MLENPIEDAWGFLVHTQLIKAVDVERGEDDKDVINEVLGCESVDDILIFLEHFQGYYLPFTEFYGLIKTHD